MTTDKPTFVENLVYEYVYLSVFVYKRAVIVCRLLLQRVFLHISLLSLAYFEIIIGDIVQKLA